MLRLDIAISNNHDKFVSNRSELVMRHRRIKRVAADTVGNVRIYYLCNHALALKALIAGLAQVGTKSKCYCDVSRGLQKPSQ